MWFIRFISDGDTLKLLRFPFSFFLMPVYFFAFSQIEIINYTNATIAFLVLHLFIYPASNGYNSYMDQDVTSIGGLKNPPKATKNLFYASVLFDAIGLILSCVISAKFCVLVVLYMLASRAYSYKGIRLKKMPIIGFFTVVVFQGAFTFYMVAYACSDVVYEVNSINLFALLASSLLIGGVYPLTQIYQHQSDAANGDHTISYKLGYKGTFIFSACMFICAGISLYVYFYLINANWQFVWFQFFLLPTTIYFLWWFYKVVKDSSQANFENTMRMNFLSSTCVSVCFIIIRIIK